MPISSMALMWAQKQLSHRTPRTLVWIGNTGINTHRIIIQISSEAKGSRGSQRVCAWMRWMGSVIVCASLKSMHEPQRLVLNVSCSIWQHIQGVRRSREDPLRNMHLGTQHPHIRTMQTSAGSVHMERNVVLWDWLNHMDGAYSCKRNIDMHSPVCNKRAVMQYSAWRGRRFKEQCSELQWKIKLHRHSWKPIREPGSMSYDKLWKGHTLMFLIESMWRKDLMDFLWQVSDSVDKGWIFGHIDQDEFYKMNNMTATTKLTAIF